MIGRTLGRYKILRNLGSGNAGGRYVAEDTARGRNVVLTVLAPESTKKEGGEDSQSQELWKRAQAVSAMSHPNVMSILDFGEEQGVSYVVTERLEGQSLRDRMLQRRLSPIEAVGFARQIAEGLAAAHGRDIVHGELNPENILITKEGKIKVLILGVVETVGDSAATQPGMETVGYQSPERLKGKPRDPRSDVFSFGAVMYEMLSGAPAFGGDSTTETMAAILDKDPPALSKSTSLPPSLEKIVAKCLKKNPADRFPSAQEVAVAIDALSEERTTERPPVVDDEPATRRKWKLF